MMLIRKTWQREGSHHASPFQRRRHIDSYEGWFLFGIIPLYISRTRKVFL